jgi:hypothetical protein
VGVPPESDAAHVEPVRYTKVVPVTVNVPLVAPPLNVLPELTVYVPPPLAAPPQGSAHAEDVGEKL